MELTRTAAGKEAVETALNDISKAGAPVLRKVEESRLRSLEKQSVPEIE